MDQENQASNEHENVHLIQVDNNQEENEAAPLQNNGSEQIQEEDQEEDESEPVQQRIRKFTKEMTNIKQEYETRKEKWCKEDEEKNQTKKRWLKAVHGIGGCVREYMAQKKPWKAWALSEQGRKELGFGYSQANDYVKLLVNEKWIKDTFEGRYHLLITNAHKLKTFVNQYSKDNKKFSDDELSDAVRSFLDKKQSDANQNQNSNQNQRRPTKFTAHEDKKKWNRIYLVMYIEGLEKKIKENDDDFNFKTLFPKNNQAN